MVVLETLKKLTEKATGLARPTRDQIEDLVRLRKANTIKFEDDGVIPNHGHWPFVFYRGVVALPDDLDPAAIMEDLFELNGWGDSWRNGIYDYVHYHSRIHEVLGKARGKGTVRCARHVWPCRRACPNAHHVRLTNGRATGMIIRRHRRRCFVPSAVAQSSSRHHRTCAQTVHSSDRRQASQQSNLVQAQSQNQ